ncbi:MULTISPECIES: hypothetical protein [Paenibacillus]|uniref:hypothetical protein n=1 Tax=Paenibacillus TaxID=44249 RepID=UPI000BBD7324|nr:hypothetical protein [Paenibacillus lautus]PCL93095.1 hypothetical protein CPZ30_06365 [Paenibacillus lautus]
MSRLQLDKRLTIFPFNFIKVTGRITHQSELIEESLVKDTLKLAYVALSRPRYFAGVAMHKENVSDETILVAARHYWRIVKVEEEHESLSEELSHLTLQSVN